MTQRIAGWTGNIATEDTKLHVNDTGGHGHPVIYLNGGFASCRHWRRVIRRLDNDTYRHITFDARARGKSGTCADTSFAACLRDITTIMDARDVTRPVLVGWSYGASLAAAWAADHPGALPGIVLVDGAMPYGLSGPEGEETIRAVFRRFRWFLPLGAPLGLAARMSWEAHAENNIEANRVFAHCAPTLEAITCPARYVLGSGGHLGASADVMADVRDSLTPILERNPNLAIHAQVGSSHSKILERDAAAVASAIRETVRHGQ